MNRFEMVSPRLVILAAVFVAFTLLPASGDVVQAEEGPSLIGLVPEAPEDTLMTLVLARTDDEVKRDLKSIHAVDAAASGDLAEAKVLLSQVKAQIEVKKSEIKTTEAEIKLANEQERKIEKENLERRKKLEQLVLKMLEKRRDLRETEIQMAEARKKYAESTIKFFETEIQLNTKRSQWQSFQIGGEVKNAKPLTELQKEVRELERKALDALKKAAERRQEFAGKEKQQVERRLSLFSAQKSFLEATR